MEITIGLAFMAGLASFLSPCVISLVPVYISYLTGKTVTDELAEKKLNQFTTLLHGVAFIFGFSIVFILLGLTFSGIGNLLYQGRGFIEKIGGIIVVIFGLQVTGIIKIPILEYDIHPKNKSEKNLGLLTSFIMGVIFSAGWSPCIGPILGSILLITLNNGKLENGTILMISYSTGMAVPFLLAAFTTDWLIKVIRQYKKTLKVVEYITGIAMIFVGIMLFFGMFRNLSGYGSLIDLGL